MGNIIAGIFIIGYGVLNGGSVFTGNPTGIDYFFDGLGVCWILYGIYQVKSGK